MNQSETQNISIENKEKQRVIGQAHSPEIQHGNQDSPKTEGPATSRQRRSAASITSVEEIDQMTDTEIHFVRISRSTNAKIKALIMAGDSYIVAKRSAIKFNFIKKRIEQKMGSQDFGNARRNVWKKKKGKEGMHEPQRKPREETMSDACKLESQTRPYQQKIVLPNGGLRWDNNAQLERHCEEDNIYDYQKGPYDETIKPFSSKLQDVSMYQLETRPYQKSGEQQIKTNIQWGESSTESLRYDLQERFYPKTSMPLSILQKKRNAVLSEHSFREARHELQVKLDSIIPLSSLREQRNSPIVEPFFREAYRYDLHSRPYQETDMSPNRQSLQEKVRLKELSSNEARRYEFQQRPYKETSPYQSSGLREQNNARLEESFREEYSYEPQKPWQETVMARNGRQLQWNSNCEDLSFSESRKKLCHRTDLPFSKVDEQNNTQLEPADTCRYQPQTEFLYQETVMPFHEQQLETNASLGKPSSYEFEKRLCQKTRMPPSFLQEPNNTLLTESSFRESTHELQTKPYQESVIPPNGYPLDKKSRLEELSSNEAQSYEYQKSSQKGTIPLSELLSLAVREQKSSQLEKISFNETHRYEPKRETYIIPRSQQKLQRNSRSQDLSSNEYQERSNQEMVLPSSALEERNAQLKLLPEQRKGQLMEFSFYETPCDASRKRCYKERIMPLNGLQQQKNFRLNETSLSEARYNEPQKRPYQGTVMSPSGQQLQENTRSENYSPSEANKYGYHKRIKPETIIPSSRDMTHLNKRLTTMSFKNEGVSKWRNSLLKRTIKGGGKILMTYWNLSTRPTDVSQIK